MARAFVLFFAAAAVLAFDGCGGGGSSGSGGGGGGSQSNAPTLTSIAPSSAAVGTPALSIVAYGSAFQDGVAIQWNGTPLKTSCVDVNTLPAACSSAASLIATVPASDIAAAGTVQITLSNPSGASVVASNALDFKIAPAPAATTWARAVAGILVPNDIVWDSVHGRLYVSVGSTDPANANTIAVIDPVAGNATSFVSGGSNPDLLSVSSDSSYLWAGLDGSNSVQRFLLPSMSKDISFSVPPDWSGNPEQAVSLQAAPGSPHTLGLVAGHWGWSPTGQWVYVYDDATARTNYVSNKEIFYNGLGPTVDWIQWGADDTTVYGNPSFPDPPSGIAKMQVDSSGVTLSSNSDGSPYLPSDFSQYDRSNGLLYAYGGAYDPNQLSMAGSFDFPELYDDACTADSGLGRYYCVFTYSIGGSDVTAFELWVYDLTSYALINRIFLGETASSSPSPISGAPLWLVRWGNSGLALLTQNDPIDGNGGIFLIDGAAVNPNAAPDSTSGTANGAYAWLSSMSPDSATTASGEVAVTINGNGFSPDSTACWNCSNGTRFLPTTYLSSTQLDVTIPLASVSMAEPIEINVYDAGSNLFSTNALTFTVLPSSGTTQLTPVNLCGLAEAWDQNSQLLYVATADYDGAYPNSVVAVNPTTGAVAKSQVVGENPAFLSDSANGEYLYVGYVGATEMTQLQLPSLNALVSWPLDPLGYGSFPAEDLKAAPADPQTTAVTFYNGGTADPSGIGILEIFGDSSPLPTMAMAPPSAPLTFDYIAWSNTDANLAVDGGGEETVGGGALSSIAVDSSGATYISNNPAAIQNGEIHSDLGTGLVYGDNGNVADPITGALVGTYNASGLVAPDSSLNRVFILGQTSSQTDTYNFTIQSFDEKGFTPISSITLNNLSGSPIEMVRWGASGLAVLTTGGYDGGYGMLYLIQDSSFVSNLPASSFVQPEKQGLVQQRWKRLSKRKALALALAHQAFTTK
jgi:hypothetical protein